VVWFASLSTTKSYEMGLFSRLFHRSAPPPATKKLSAAEVENIVHAYAAALSSRKSMISDASELPYPKATIKAALIAAISVTQNAAMREQLKACFITLAGWQEGYGPGPDSFALKQMDSEDTLAFVKRVAAASPAIGACESKVAAEAQAFYDELKALGL
jgi:hypothetical protein